MKEPTSRSEEHDDKPWLKHLRQKTIVPIPEVSESELGEEDNKEENRDKWIVVRTESEESAKSAR